MIELLTCRSVNVGVRFAVRLAIRTVRADLLIDIEVNIAIGMDARLDTQNNARVLVGDGIENGIGGWQWPSSKYSRCLS